MRELRQGVICPKEKRFISIGECKQCNYFWKVGLGVTSETRGEETVECEYKRR